MTSSVVPLRLLLTSGIESTRGLCRGDVEEAEGLPPRGAAARAPGSLGRVPEFCFSARTLTHRLHELSDCLGLRVRALDREGGVTSAKPEAMTSRTWEQVHARPPATQLWSPCKAGPCSACLAIGRGHTVGAAAGTCAADMRAALSRGPSLTNSHKGSGETIQNFKMGDTSMAGF